MSNVPPPPPPPGYGGGQQPPAYGAPGYGAPGYGPPGYGAPGQYGYGGPAREHPDGTTVLVLGILGLVVCNILAPFAWVKGNKAKREMDAHPEVMWTNRGNVTAGRILGIIGSVLILLVIGIIALALIAAAATA